MPKKLPQVTPSPNNVTPLTAAVMTVEDIVAYLRVPASTVRKIVRQGKVRYAKIGKRFLIPRAEVDAFLEASLKRQGEPRPTA